jgi:hypothetical protein
VQLFDYFNFDEEELPKDAFPVAYESIATQQQKDPSVMKFIGINEKYTLLHAFCGDEKQWQLVVFRQNIVIPQALQK